MGFNIFEKSSVKLVNILDDFKNVDVLKRSLETYLYYT